MISEKNSLKHHMFIETFLGQTPKINQTAFISKSAAIIGAVEIGKNCSVWHHTTIRGDANFIKIGEGTNIQDNSVCHTDDGMPLVIGDNVTVGHKVILHSC